MAPKTVIRPIKINSENLHIFSKREQTVRHFPGKFPENSGTIEFSKGKTFHRELIFGHLRNEMKWNGKFPANAVPFLRYRKF